MNDPRDAVRTAERVVGRVLEDRGYPVDVDLEDQAAHVAADFPDVVERYRHGHAMLEQVDGGESTENLRKAMIDSAPSSKSWSKASEPRPRESAEKPGSA